ncbi:MAG: PIN domain-containing protein [Candidatus Latescibacteria bacterium]|nr:PIN domain-containing protein [Candidatus Latescibacterota bacterium]
MVYLPDTNIISAILRKNPVVRKKWETALKDGHSIVISPVVEYEIRRGLLKKDAQRQTEFFDQLSAVHAGPNLIREDWRRAAELWVQRQAIGRPTGDSDILIAAYALRLGATIVTDNEKDFEGLSLMIENWLTD